MPGLADIVLSANDIVDAAENGEDNDPELAAMQRELAELQARRRGESSSESAQASTVAPSTIVSVDNPATRLTTPPGKTPSRPYTGRKGAASLADTILNSATGEDALDQELENMEKELQKHLNQYRTQCQEAPSPVAAKASMGATSSSNVAEVDAPDAAAGIAEEDSTALKTTDAELIALQVQAQRMDEAFPEPDVDPDGSAAEPKRRYPQLRTYERNYARDAPNEEIEDMRSTLDELDIRLRAMQQREVMQDKASKDDSALIPASSEGNGALAHIRAQNEHLRARLQGSQPKGLLNLDRSFFTADGSAVSGNVGYGAG